MRFIDPLIGGRNSYEGGVHYGKEKEGSQEDKEEGNEEAKGLIALQ
jgi:hypothetical protein